LPIQTAMVLASRVVVNAKGGIMLPKGTTAQRPQLSSVRQPTDANGTIRYNTSNYQLLKHT
jgi:hypothetical protein